MTRFDEDTGLTPISPGVYEGRNDPSWRIIRGANGGHIAAVLMRGMALGLAEPDRTPRSLTVHFLRVPREEPFTIEAAVERRGRTMSTTTARYVQDGKLIAAAIAAFSIERTGYDFSEISMPEVPPPDECERVPERDDFPFGQHFDVRRALGAQVPDPANPAETGVWIRLKEARLVDYLLATQLMDAWAPSIFAKLGQGGGGAGVPTIDMTFHYRETLPITGAKPDDWYLGVFRTQTSRGGFIEEDGWLWSQRGTLVAQSRQLALLTT
ncbi:MAG TPA: thioesterase family protein [Actinomycetota bacterium]|nr:thioesterase family protein [Actinomycetota bacterium]